MDPCIYSSFFEQRVKKQHQTKQKQNNPAEILSLSCMCLSSSSPQSPVSWEMGESLFWKSCLMWGAHYASSVSCATRVVKMWWNLLWMLIIRVISWNIHVIYGTCEQMCAAALKKNKHIFLVFLTFSMKRPKESWNETAWPVHIAQVEERNTRYINMASLHMLTLNSFMLFKVWNAVNVIEMCHKNNNNIWQNMNFIR